MLGLFNFKVTYVCSEETCSSCGSKLHSKGYFVRKPNGMSNIYIKEYVCSDCNKRMHANFNEFIEPNSNYTNTIKHFGVKLSEIGEESYEKKSELFETIYSL